MAVREEPPPRFMLRTEGDEHKIYLIDPWPETMRFCPHFMQEIDEGRTRGVSREDDEITLVCENAEATYRIVAVDKHDVHHTEAVQRSWRGVLPSA